MTGGGYVLRAVWFVIKLVLLAGLVLFGAWYCFFTMLNAGDAFIIVNDGMKVRASMAIKGEDDYELEKYFSSDFLYGDILLTSGLYDNYDIDRFDYSIKIKWIDCGPTGGAITVKAEERVDNFLLKPGEDNKNAVPPVWQNNAYDITLVKNAEDGRWLIDKLEITGGAGGEETAVELVQ